MGKQAPQAPDPYKTAEAQSKSNKDTAVAQAGLNFVDQKTPYGSLTYKQTGTWADGTPRFEATTTLDPVQEALFRTGQRTNQNLASLGEQQSQRLGGILGGQINTPKLDGTLDPESYAAGRQRVEDALFARLDPKLQQDRTSLESDLANRGIRIGSTAYDAAQRDFGQNVNDARTSAILAAGQEQSRLQGMDIASRQFGNDVAQQGFGNDLTKRNQGLNEIIGLATGTQVQQPQFQPTPQTGVGGVDIAGLINNRYNADLNSYNQQQSNLLGGLFGLGKAAIGLF